MTELPLFINIKNKFKLFILFTWIFFLLGISGCAGFQTYNAATGRQEFIFIPTDEEVTMGKEIHQKLLSEYKLSSDQAKVSRLRRIGARVSQVSDRQDYQYHFFLIEKDELNAFTVPGGNVYCFTGLFDKLKTDDQIASVLAHEVGHCAARHTVKKFQASMGYSLVGNIVFNTLKIQDQTKRLLASGSNALMNLIFSAYSRQDEFQADHLGVKYLDRAGYKVNAMIETFEILKKESNGPQPPLILRTHPYIDDRIEAVKKEIPRIKSGEE